MSEPTAAPGAAAPDPQSPPADDTMSPAAANRLENLRALRPGQVILAVGGAVIVTVVLVLAIGRLAGFTKLGDTLDGATWGWLGLCALGQIGVFVGYAGAFRASLAEPAPPVPGSERQRPGHRSREFPSRSVVLG